MSVQLGPFFHAYHMKLFLVIKLGADALKGVNLVL
jgi:hypothetical protein